MIVLLPARLLLNFLERQWSLLSTSSFNMIVVSLYLYVSATLRTLSVAISHFLNCFLVSRCCKTLSIYLTNLCYNVASKVVQFQLSNLLMSSVQFQPSNLLMSSACSIILWTHPDDAVKPLKCIWFYWVDKGWITTVKDLGLRSDEGLMLSFLNLSGWLIKPNFCVTLPQTLYHIFFRN